MKSKQKQYCNKFNKIIIVHIKKKKLKKKHCRFHSIIIAVSEEVSFWSSIHAENISGENAFFNIKIV